MLLPEAPLRVGSRRPAWSVRPTGDRGVLSRDAGAASRHVSCALTLTDPPTFSDDDRSSFGTPVRVRPHPWPSASAVKDAAFAGTAAVTGIPWSKPAVAAGDFFVLAGETFAAMFRRPFAWRELIEQIWFVARVSIVPTVVLSIPYTVLIVFTLNIVLIEVGAGDLSGAGAAWHRSPRWARWSPPSSSPGRAPPRCAPIWAPGRSAKKSTR